MEVTLDVLPKNNILLSSDWGFMFMSLSAFIPFLLFIQWSQFFPLFCFVLFHSIQDFSFSQWQVFLLSSNKKSRVQLSKARENELYSPRRWLTERKEISPHTFTYAFSELTHVSERMAQWRGRAATNFLGLSFFLCKMRISDLIILTKANLWPKRLALCTN